MANSFLLVNDFINNNKHVCFLCLYKQSCSTPVCTVQIRGKVNISRGRPAGRMRPDVSVTAGACCSFRRRSTVTPVCTRAADCTRRFLVEQ